MHKGPWVTRNRCMEAVLRNRSSPTEQSGPCPAIPGDLTHGCSRFQMENQDPFHSSSAWPGVPRPSPAKPLSKNPSVFSEGAHAGHSNSHSAVRATHDRCVWEGQLWHGWFVRRGHCVPVGHWHQCIEEWAFWLPPPHRKETFSKRRTPSPKEPWSTGWHHTHLFLVPCQPCCWRKLSEGARTQPTQNQVLCVRYPGTSPKNQ